MRNIISDRIQCTIMKMCHAIEKKNKLNSENLKVLKSNQRQLEKAYCKGAILYLKSIENIINKYIAVPSNVLLEEDKLQRTQYSEIEFENMKQNLKNLQQRAKRATIFNTALKEELQILDQFPISQDSINEMYKTVEIGLQCSDMNNKMCQLVENYKQLSTSLFDPVSVTEKLKYNTIDNLKCKDLDLNNL